MVDLRRLQLLARAKKWRDMKLGSKFRDARSRAGNLTAFILTLKGVYQVPMRAAGGALAIITAVVPFIFMYKKVKEDAVLRVAADESSIENPVTSPSTQIIQRKLEESNSIVKYLDCCVAFMGQFGTHHMEMMIVAATTGFEFVDYNEITSPQNFGMLLFATHAFCHSIKVFVETKRSYEHESMSFQMRNQGVQTELPAPSNDKQLLEIQVEKPVIDSVVSETPIAKFGLQ